MVAKKLIEQLKQRSHTVTTAESCTGGLLAAALTAVSGSSAVFEVGYITYADAAKTAVLGVPAEMLAEHGAVSAAVAEAMARGALQRSGADMALAVTGIAGPTGGSDTKPVGTVFIARADRTGGVRVNRHLFPGDRDAVRAQSVTAALQLAAEV